MDPENSLNYHVNQKYLGGYYLS